MFIFEMALFVIKAIIIGAIIGPILVFAVSYYQHKKSEKNITAPKYTDNTEDFKPFQLPDSKPDVAPTKQHSQIGISISSELRCVEVEYPLFDATKLPVERYIEYRVSGKNPTTNRIKTVTIVAKENTPENIIIERSNLLEPYTVSPYFEEATDRQISYANDLNIKFPPNCSKQDMSSLISRQLDHYYTDYMTGKLMEYASINNIYISPYDSIPDGTGIIIRRLPSDERIAFYVYLIYCSLNQMEIGNPRDLSNSHIFYDFVNTLTDIDEISTLIKDHYTYSIIAKMKVDRRNKKMAALYDQICEYLNHGV